MELPCYIIKQLMKFYYWSPTDNQSIGNKALHLSETCKLWRNLLHELWLEEKEYKYIVRCNLVSRALVYDNSLDLNVAVIVHGRAIDRLKVCERLFPEDFAFTSTYINTRLLPNFFEDIVDRWWKHRLVMHCANNGRWDLLLQLKSIVPDRYISSLDPRWSKNVQRCVSLHYLSCPISFAAGESVGAVGWYG